jgi:hypothetical protein
MTTDKEIFRCPVCLSDITDELPGLDLREFGELSERHAKMTLDFTKMMLKEKEVANDFYRMATRRLRVARTMLIMSMLVATIYCFLALLAWGN